MTYDINLPLTPEIISKLKAGDVVRLSGTMYTGRDQAHKRLIEMIEKGEDLPLEINGQTIYYTGPSPAKPGQAIGSCGPTTSYRMDSFTPQLLDLGLRGMIGKGKRNDEVIRSMQKNKAVYFSATGGAAALIAKSVLKSEIIAFKDLMSEAIYKLEVKNFPAVVAIDSFGNSLYERSSD